EVQRRHPVKHNKCGVHKAYLPLSGVRSNGLRLSWLGEARSLPSRIKRRCELVHHPLPPVRINRGASPHATNLLHGPPGTAIGWTDDEDYTLHRPESMLHHELLHLAIVSTAPVGAGKEGPADLNDAALRVIAVVA